MQQKSLDWLLKTKLQGIYRSSVSKIQKEALFSFQSFWLPLLILFFSITVIIIIIIININNIVTFLSYCLLHSSNLFTFFVFILLFTSHYFEVLFLKIYIILTFKLLYQIFNSVDFIIYKDGLTIRIIWKRQVAFVFAFFRIIVITRIDSMKERVSED